MPHDKFKVSNAAGMWVRSEPVVSEATKKVLLPRGHLVTKISDTAKRDWWNISTSFQGAEIDGVCNKNLLNPAGENGSTTTATIADLISRTLATLEVVAPRAHSNYRAAISGGAVLFEQHGITTPQRMAHLLAQAMQETGSFTVLRESMNYRAPRIIEIFGVGNHSARITAAEAATLAHNEEGLSERVYGLGNPAKARELGNTNPGDGFAYRGNGILQTTGRGNHRRMGNACGVDFEGNPRLVTDPLHALKPALQEWTEGNLNAAADANDIRKITRRINGGLNGFPERQAFYARIRPMLD